MLFNATRTQKWGLLVGLLLLTLLVPGPLNLYRAVRVNLAWTEVTKGLLEPGESLAHLRSAQRLLGDEDANLGTGAKMAGILAALGTLDPVTEHPDLSRWLPFFEGERGKILGRAAMQLLTRQAEDSESSGLLQQSIAWRRLAGGLSASVNSPRDSRGPRDPRERILKDLSDYEQAAEREPANWQYVLRLIALSNEAGDFARASYLISELPKRFPDPAYAWLHDMSNPYALSALSEAYAYVGFLDKAIDLEKQSLRKNEWAYARLLLARYLQAQGQYGESESNFLEGLASPDAGNIRPQILVALGDLYAEWGKILQAQDAYCQALRSGPPDNRVRRLIAVSAHIPEEDVMSFCSASGN